MNNNYVLDNIILRKEYFGGIICALNTLSYHQINEDAFYILSKLKTPKSFYVLTEELNNGGFFVAKKDLHLFLEEMKNLQIISESFAHQSSLIFFENDNITRTDCLNAPTSVSIYITQFCPKTCKHCVTFSNPFIDRQKEVGLTQWFEVIEKLRAFGCTTLVFTGGDCLAKDHIFEIIKKADDNKFLIGILTDYDGINSKHLQKIKQIKHLIDLQVSLDGGTKDSHDWMRGEGAFQKALRRMNLLYEARIPYTVAAAIHKNNLHEIDKIVTICQKYGANHLYLNPLAPYGRGKDLSEYFLSDEELYFLGQKYLELIANKQISSGNPFWEQSINRIGDPSFHPFKGCLESVSTGYFNLSINWNGDCYLDSKLGAEKILHLGNAIKDDIKDIWFNSKLDNVRKLYTKESAFVTQQAFVSSLNI